MSYISADLTCNMYKGRAVHTAVDCKTLTDKVWGSEQQKNPCIPPSEQQCQHNKAIVCVVWPGVVVWSRQDKESPLRTTPYSVVASTSHTLPQTGKRQRKRGKRAKLALGHPGHGDAG